VIRRLVMSVAYGAVVAFVVISAVALVRGGTLFRTPEVSMPPDSVGSTANPRPPVLLVPGWADAGDRLAPLAHRLRTSGWDSTAVVVVEFDDPVGSNVEHAEEIRVAVDSLFLLNPTATAIDIVAHSMGGLASRWYLQNGGADVVRKFVSLAGPHRGTLVSLVAWGDGGVEMKPGSEFLAELDSVLPDGVEGFTVRTELETHILPPESATLPGVPDTLLCCTMHWTLPSDDVAIEVVVDFLLRGRPE
jgi:triacylglycerol lipase